MGSLNEFLITAIKQSRHFSPNQGSRSHRQIGRVRDGNQDRTNAIFAYQQPVLACRHLTCDASERYNTEGVGAENLDGLIEVRMVGFLAHGRFPICEDV